MKITLTSNEYAQAVLPALFNVLRGHHNNRRTDHGKKSKRGVTKRFGDGVIGYCGELVVAKYLNLPWTPGDRFPTTGDVNNQIEVRTTYYENGHLLIYDVDDDDVIFYLVRGDYPTLEIVGYILGGDAKRPEWWRDGDPPCYWVPDSALTLVK